MGDKSINNFVDMIINAIETRLAMKPKAGYTKAKVLRKDDDGTVWVSIPGGAPETPCVSSVPRTI